MAAPWFSTFTLATEVLVTAAVLYTIHSGWTRNRFPSRLAGAALAYETLFNITYMAYRAATHEPRESHSAFHMTVAIFHGTFSLLMFAALLVFFGLAWHGYRRGHNFFLAHRRWTTAFVLAWLLAIGSGILFYAVAYRGAA